MKRNLLLNSAGGVLVALLGCVLPLAPSHAQYGGTSDGSYQGSSGSGSGTESDQRSTMPSDSGPSSSPSDTEERQPGAMGPIRNDTLEREDRDRERARRSQPPGTQQQNERVDPADAYRQPGTGPGGQAIPGFDTGPDTP